MIQYLGEIFKRKDLIFYLALSKLKGQHKNSYLGYFWWFLDPLISMVIYYFVVAVIFRAGGGGDYGIYLVTGIIVWRWVESTVMMAAKSILAAAPVITQVYQPKANFPIGAVFTQMINFVFGTTVIVIFMLYLKIYPGPQLLWFPVIVLLQLVFLLAIALPVAYISVFIRDFEYIVQHLMRVWFFGSPVIWRESFIPEKFKWILQINPMSHFLSAYRNIVMHHTGPPVAILAGISILALLAVFLMLNHYSRNEHKIIKII